MSRPTIPSQVQVEVPVFIFKDENGTYVAYCPPLELSSYGDTKEEAQAYFEEALHLFIEETARKGTLEKFLLKRGWNLSLIPQATYTPPVLELGTKNLLTKSHAELVTERFAVPV